MPEHPPSPALAPLGPGASRGRLCTFYGPIKRGPGGYKAGGAGPEGGGREGQRCRQSDDAMSPRVGAMLLCTLLGAALGSRLRCYDCGGGPGGCAEAVTTCGEGERKPQASLVQIRLPGNRESPSSLPSALPCLQPPLASLRPPEPFRAQSGSGQTVRLWQRAPWAHLAPGTEHPVFVSQPPPLRSRRDLAGLFTHRKSPMLQAQAKMLNHAPTFKYWPRTREVYLCMCVVFCFVLLFGFLRQGLDV
ncbi:lymphocyte antigen 6 complex locus protein G6d isoform X1 [Heterocephalus glaber]|uniref:Lymphocyte antigen 6 complex locus protein G6d isoform X1 n=1 Tax=Heterocephalus glaber TaxID=10181 RepID=A0AAX6T6V8_HETGA|nr:lymphocyte antigen 6 complex locus protein G6d isoform X1 [Heterocephalus glaber]